MGGAFVLIVGRGGLYGFVINPRVQLALLIRRAAGVFILLSLRCRLENRESRLQAQVGQQPRQAGGPGAGFLFDFIDLFPQGGPVRLFFRLGYQQWPQR